MRIKQENTFIAEKDITVCKVVIKSKLLYNPSYDLLEEIPKVSIPFIFCSWGVFEIDSCIIHRFINICDISLIKCKYLFNSKENSITIKGIIPAGTKYWYVYRDIDPMLKYMKFKTIIIERISMIIMDLKDELLLK